jgi:hypothetical protein
MASDGIGFAARLTFRLRPVKPGEPPARAARLGQVAAQGVAGVRRLDAGAGEPSLELVVHPAEELREPGETRPELLRVGGGGEADGEAVERQHERQGEE